MCCTVALASDKKNALAGGNTAEGLCVLASVCWLRALAVPVGRAVFTHIAFIVFCVRDCFAIHHCNG